MSNLTKDPKGYYAALGVGEDADADAIKAAFRTKAKRLHPDFNPSPVAAKQFHRLREAYEALSNSETRATYDRPWKEAAKAAPKNGSDKRTEPPKPKPEAKPQAETKPKAEPPKARPMASPNVEPPSVCKCGKVTAQPRYVVFDMVWGRLNTLQRRGVSGVFCRSCADRTAVFASLVTWLAGWWAWPHGPRETVKALISNIRGGRKPPTRNARLLMRQAKAFRARGEMHLARNAAEQALPFAATPELRREVDTLLMSLSAFPARALKSRWDKPGWAPMVQMLPLVVVVAALSMTATMMAPKSLTQFVRELDFHISWPEFTKAEDPKPAVTGRVYSVSAQSSQLREDSKTDGRVVAMLSRGNIVLVTETNADGNWVKVLTADGAVGFLPASDISPDVTADALTGIGAFDAGVKRPE